MNMSTTIDTQQIIINEHSFMDIISVYLEIISDTKCEKTRRDEILKLYDFLSRTFYIWKTPKFQLLSDRIQNYIPYNINIMRNQPICTTCFIQKGQSCEYRTNDIKKHLTYYSILFPNAEHIFCQSTIGLCVNMINKNDELKICKYHYEWYNMVINILTTNTILCLDVSEIIASYCI
jgi:hypothetical protein